ncbi:MAG: HAMP domain-containing histidine kinase [Lachnospiraceae bacterium]|nr:HAMP domain-containing histidine kinase [Lachnospiraceae bacterium]
MNEWLLITAGIVTAGALFYAFYKEYRTGKIIRGLQKMLEEATRGEFRESGYSEDEVSKLESKLADYLESSALSAANVKKDRDKIKTLIADISHQTKTPIANLILHSELLKESELTSDQRESLTAIENEAEKLRFLVDALVKLSRLENGIMVLEPKEDDLSRLVKEVGNTMRLKAEGKGLYLHTAEESERASFDYKWTLEAVSNIVDNAVKYTDNGGIEISFKSTEMFACISVRDTGIGIAESDIPRIFSRFGRLQSSREKEGVGIGLYLAREIITKEGGYIKVNSEPGEGTEFLIYLKK